MSVFEPDGDFIHVAVGAAHQKVAVVRRTQAAFEILDPDLDGVVTRAARSSPADVLRALCANLSPLRGQGEIDMFQALISGCGQPVGAAVDRSPVFGYADTGGLRWSSLRSGAILFEMRADVVS